MTWADNLLEFYRTLQPPPTLPSGIAWLLPQHNPEVQIVQQCFFSKFYSDDQPRILLLGINPGRFGAGVTGINFTASKQLTEHCGIEHYFKKGSELSAEFIYEVITAYGGPQKFYSRFFIGSVCPLGFVQNGKNINYYDDKELLKVTEPFVVAALKKLISFPVTRNYCICIGGEKNFRYLSSLNEQHHFFNEIIPVPHPRFIMQYRRKQKDEFIAQYLSALSKNPTFT